MVWPLRDRSNWLTLLRYPCHIPGEANKIKSNQFRFTIESPMFDSFFLSAKLKKKGLNDYARVVAL